MLSSSLPQRFVRSTSQTVRFISSDAAVVTRHDLALEKRRADRLAREALRQEHEQAAARGIAPRRTYATKREEPMFKMVSASAGTFGNYPVAPFRPRAPLNGGRRGSNAMAKRGTERSRTHKPIMDPAGSIRDFTAREAARRAERVERTAKSRASKVDNKLVDANEGEIVTPELPQFMSPEPIAPDIAAALDEVPTLAPSHPSSLPTTHKGLSPEWLKCTHGGDYSKYQLDKRDYLRGSRGVGHSYARIVLERNGTLQQDSRKQLHWFIQWATQQPKPRPKPISIA